MPPHSVQLELVTAPLTVPETSQPPLAPLVYPRAGMVKEPALASAQVTGPIEGVGFQTGAGAWFTVTLTVTSGSVKQAGNDGAG